MDKLFGFDKNKMLGAGYKPPELKLPKPSIFQIGIEAWCELEISNALHKHRIEDERNKQLKVKGEIVKMETESKENILEASNKQDLIDKLSEIVTDFWVNDFNKPSRDNGDDTLGGFIAIAVQLLSNENKNENKINKEEFKKHCKEYIEAGIELAFDFQNKYRTIYLSNDYNPQDGLAYIVEKIKLPLQRDINFSWKTCLKIEIENDKFTISSKKGYRSSFIKICSGKMLWE